MCIYRLSLYIHTVILYIYVYVLAAISHHQTSTNWPASPGQATADLLRVKSVANAAGAAAGCSKPTKPRPPG